MAYALSNPLTLAAFMQIGLVGCNNSSQTATDDAATDDVATTETSTNANGTLQNQRLRHYRCRLVRLYSVLIHRG